MRRREPDALPRRAGLSRPNGVDEDCDGADDINLDVDGDGYKRPDDCNDRNAKIKPNAVEKRGNKVDENCDGRLQDSSPWTCS